MKLLLDFLLKNKTYKQIKQTIAAENECHVNGLWGSSWAYFVSATALDLQKTNKGQLTLLFITDSVIDAEECCEEIDLFMPESSLLLPPLEVIDELEINENYSMDISLVERMNVLQHFIITDPNYRKDEQTANENNTNGNRIKIVVSSIHALMQEMPQPEDVCGNTLSIAIGNEYDQETLECWLKDRGFEKVSQVETGGEFSIRGGIIDVFPFSSSDPYRIEFFGDEVDSIRIFEVDSQMSLSEVKSCQIIAAKNKKREKPYDNTDVKSTIVSYLPADTIIVFKNGDNIEEKANSIIPEPGMCERSCSYDNIKEDLAKFKKIYISTLDSDIEIEADNDKKAKVDFTFSVNSLERFSQGLAPSMKELKTICSECKRTIVLCNNEAEEHRFLELLKDHGIDKKSLELQVGRLAHGFQFTDLKITLLSYNEIFKRYELRKSPKTPVKAKPIESFIDLKKGDLVVHVVHGIARFKNIKELETVAPDKSQSEIDLKFGYDTTELNKQGDGANKREYLVLEFAEGTIVYVPAANIDLVQKYIGPSEHRPRLSKIGSKSWSKKKEQARKSVTDIAQELINLQAIRASTTGFACKEDDEWQKEFEEAFIYQETEDQIIVANAIHRDIESPIPMDRLVCGDVGYGKTELAMRAAFKIVMNGKQVAILVPTTILAQQHYRSFSERMADYPIKIDVISRFRTKKEQKEILEKAAEGNLDIVIGTHRLVQKDVVFKDIGLVVIDEEQKFGVAHKEKFKTLRHIVDVLTLTATPIPRTLHMSMLGLRDISSLNTPPIDRKSIQTRIIRHRPDLIRKIIIHELNRNGQIFFVHNRVYNIERVACSIKELVPEARIVVGHGQMHENMLAQRMQEFVNGDADILVSTTIIESGLDIPNANTIIINDAHTFGLADLHQLRGRVGRYKHKAYAYLVLPVDRPITPEAEKKVKAIEEFSNLGAGFKIALRDLEIRGAGNFLGAEQSGSISAVGYEMYCSMLEVVVKRLKNQPIPVQINVSMNLDLNAYIPKDYIPDYSLKMEMYRKLNRLQNIKEVKEIGLLFNDRFGKPPKPVKNLLLEAEVRIIAYNARIRSISCINEFIIISHVEQKGVVRALSSIEKMLRFINKNTIHIKIDTPKMPAEKILQFLKTSLTKKTDEH